MVTSGFVGMSRAMRQLPAATVRAGHLAFDPDLYRRAMRLLTAGGVCTRPGGALARLLSVAMREGGSNMCDTTVLALLAGIGALAYGGVRSWCCSGRSGATQFGSANHGSPKNFSRCQCVGTLARRVR